MDFTHDNALLQKLHSKSHIFRNIFALPTIVI